MNPTWTDADTWLDVADHVVIGIVAILVAGIPSWFAARNHRAIKRIDGKTAQITSQVVNGHATNPDLPSMRDDMDEVKAAMTRWEPVLGMVDDLRAGMEALSHQMRSFRQDLMAEEDRRRVQISDLRDEMDRNNRGQS